MQVYLSGVWLAVLGFFLTRAASASYQTAVLRDMLAGVRVRQLMVREAITVPDHLSLDEMVQETILRHPHRVYPGMNGDQVIGLIGIEQVRRVPRPEWIRTPVRQVMTPAAQVPPVAPEDETVIVLERMIREDALLLPVVQEGRMVGILSRGDILQHYQIRSTLAVP